MQITLSDRLTNRADYTFRFSLDSGFAPTEDSLRSTLQQAYSFVDNVRVSRGIFSNVYAIQFTWVGANAIPMSAAVGAMTEVLGAHWPGFQFVDAETNRVSQAGDLATPVLNLPKAIAQGIHAVTGINLTGDTPPPDGSKLPSIKEILVGAGIVVVVGVAVYAFVSRRSGAPVINVKEIVRSAKRKLMGRK